MLHNYVRVFLNDNGSFTDYSLLNSDESSTLAIPLVATEDYIYIGKYYPFNNFFLDVDTVNDQAATLTVDVWDGTQWRSSVDVLDGTSSGGVSLAKSGVVEFSIDKDYSWNRVFDSSDTNAPDEMQGEFTIYNLYWIRLKWSADLAATTELNTIAYAFTSSQQLDNIYNQINQYLTSFGSGKTDWNDEIVTASLHVVKTLKKNRLIVNEGQIIKLDDVSLATDYKTLELIFNSLGPSYAEERDRVSHTFSELISMPGFTFDRNNDAAVDTFELNSSYGRLKR